MSTVVPLAVPWSAEAFRDPGRVGTLDTVELVLSRFHSPRTGLPEDRLGGSAGTECHVGSNCSVQGIDSRTWRHCVKGGARSAKGIVCSKTSAAESKSSKRSSQCSVSKADVEEAGWAACGAGL